MADRLKKLRVVDPVLTNLARGYRNPQYVGENLFPVAEMNKESGVIPLFGKEAFMLWNTERAIRAHSNVMTTDDVDTMDVVLREHDLAYPIDYREQAESMFNEETKAARRVKDAIDLEREVTIARLAQNPNTYRPGGKVTLSGTSQWSNGGGDPIQVVETGKEVIRQQTGSRPNMAIIGVASYDALKFHPKLAAALGANEQKLITLEHLKELWGIENIYIGEALVADDKGATTNVWSDNVVLAYVAKPEAGQAGDYDTPSFGYTLRKKGMPETDTYYASGNKVKYVRHTDIYKVAVVGADAGYLIADTNA